LFVFASLPLSFTLSLCFAPLPRRYLFCLLQMSFILISCLCPILRTNLSQSYTSLTPSISSLASLPPSSLTSAFNPLLLVYTSSTKVIVQPFSPLTIASGPHRPACGLHHSFFHLQEVTWVKVDESPSDVCIFEAKMLPHETSLLSKKNIPRHIVLSM
jgi:hypothetical protein